MNQKNQTSKNDVYQIVTNKVIEQLEKGCVPWKRPWTAAGLPQNLITRKPYRGINVMLLAQCGYSQNLFLTFKQAKELGASIKKGEKAQIVIYWKRIVKEGPEEGATESILRYYKVYNISQCNGIPESKLPPPELQNEPILDCEQIIIEMPKRPAIQQVEDTAYYHPIHDYVNMPPMKNLLHSEAYCSTLFRQLIHSTGHTSRINRKELMQMKPFNSEMFTLEELIAEMGASFLNSLTGIEQKEFQQDTSYIQGWLSKLKNDKRLIVTAGGLAQKAVDFILDVRHDDLTEKEKNVETNESNSVSA
ncbi:MAG TPA: ArdC-like ssDNA-binding domain-containing protein [Bacteroidia bacterium]|nr:ArdC-like ssDNA-binding domain-containing protein [Bacteroidia bacterium]